MTGVRKHCHISGQMIMLSAEPRDIESESKEQAIESMQR